MDPNDSPSETGEVLSQAEVERLLAQVTEQESKATIVKSDGAKEDRLKDSIQPYDFRNPTFLAASEMRRLRVAHEEYLTRLAALLSIYLRVDFTVKLQKLQTIPYNKFTETIGSPAHLVLFKMEPMRGICVLDISPRLGLAMVDRLMGGSGHSAPQNQELSEIEAALLDQVAQVMISEWANHWRDLQEMKPAILGHENSGQFLQTSHSDTVMLVVTFEARMADCLEQVQLAFPNSTVETIVRQLGQKNGVDGSLANATAGQKPKWNAELEKANIKVTAEWPALEMTVRDLTNLKVGDVLPLESEVVNHVRLRLASLPKFLGRLGTQGNKWAVEVTQTIKS
jgi:flagellar motor switch protein FliM